MLRVNLAEKGKGLGAGVGGSKVELVERGRVGGRWEEKGEGKHGKAGLFKRNYFYVLYL